MQDRDPHGRFAGRIGEGLEHKKWQDARADREAKTAERQQQQAARQQQQADVQTALDALKERLR